MESLRHCFCLTIRLFSIPGGSCPGSFLIQRGQLPFPLVVVSLRNIGGISRCLQMTDRICIITCRIAAVGRIRRFNRSRSAGQVNGRNGPVFHFVFLNKATGGSDNGFPFLFSLIFGKFPEEFFPKYFFFRLGCFVLFGSRSGNGSLDEFRRRLLTGLGIGKDGQNRDVLTRQVYFAQIKPDMIRMTDFLIVFSLLFELFGSENQFRFRLRQFDSFFRSLKDIDNKAAVYADRFHIVVFFKEPYNARLTATHFQIRVTRFERSVIAPVIFENFHFFPDDRTADDIFPLVHTAATERNKQKRYHANDDQTLKQRHSEVILQNIGRRSIAISLMEKGHHGFSIKDSVKDVKGYWEGKFRRNVANGHSGTGQHFAASQNSPSQNCCEYPGYR